MLSEMRSFLNVNETSFQGASSNWRGLGAPAGILQVPFDAQTLFTTFSSNASFYNFRDQNCSNKCMIEGNPTPPTVWSRFTSAVTVNGGTVTATDWSEGARASVGKRCGKWYFEVTMESEGNWVSPGAIGVGARSVSLSGLSLGLETSLILKKPTILRPYGGGDVISVASDLDAGVVHFSVNGGTPVSRYPREIYYETYYPMVNLSDGDQLKANFGSAPFLYSAPVGFKGWDEN